MVDDLFLATGVFEYDGNLNEGAEVSSYQLHATVDRTHQEYICPERKYLLYVMEWGSMIYLISCLDHDIFEYDEGKQETYSCGILEDLSLWFRCTEAGQAAQAHHNV